MTNKMDYYKVIFTTIVLTMGIINAQNIPSSITPCRRQDPAFIECFLSESRKFFPEFVEGNPTLGVPVMDPFFTEGDEFTTPEGFTAKAKDMELFGFKDAILDDIKMDFKKQKLIWKSSGNFSIHNKFEMIGRLLAFPLNVKGKLNMDIENFRMKFIHDLETIEGDDGKKYFHIKHTAKELQFGNVHFNLKGFLNKDVDATMNSLLNNNWREVISEIGGPAIDILFKRIFDVFNTFLSKIPEDVLFPE